MSYSNAGNRPEQLKHSSALPNGFKLLAKLEHKKAYPLSWSPSGKMLALASDWGEVSIWNAATGLKISSTIKDVYEDRVTCIAWSPDESLVAVGGSADSQSVSVWKIDNGQLIRVFKEKHRESVSCVIWCQRFIFTGCEDPYVRIWDPVTGKLVNKLPIGVSDKKIENFDGNISLEPSPDGQFIAVCGYKRDAIICLADDPSEFRTIPLARQGMATSSAWSPNGQHLALSGMDRVVRILDVSQNRIIAFVDTPAEEFSSEINYSFDGRLLAVHFSYLKERPVIARCDTCQITGDLFPASSILFSPRLPLLAIPIPDACEIYEFDTKLLLKRWPLSGGSDHIPKPTDEKLLSDGQKAVLAALAGRALTAKELGKELDTTQEAIRQQIRALRKAGYSIKRSGAGYFRPDNPPT